MSSANRKDMRREELVIPYFEPENKKGDADPSSTMATTMPMVAMFMRNKAIGWCSILFSIQYWLAETPEQRRNATQPGYFTVFMSMVAVLTTYIPLFLPPKPDIGGTGGSGTEPPAAAPPS